MIPSLVEIDEAGNQQGCGCWWDPTSDMEAWRTCHPHHTAEAPGLLLGERKATAGPTWCMSHYHHPVQEKKRKGLSVWTITLLSLEGKILVRVVSGTPALTPPTVSAYVAVKEPALLGPSGPAVDGNLWRFLFILLFRYNSYSFRI